MYSPKIGSVFRKSHCWKLSTQTFLIIHFLVTSVFLILHLSWKYLVSCYNHWKELITLVREIIINFWNVAMVNVESAFAQ